MISVIVIEITTTSTKDILISAKFIAKQLKSCLYQVQSIKIEHRLVDHGLWRNIIVVDRISPLREMSQNCCCFYYVQPDMIPFVHYMH